MAAENVCIHYLPSSPMDWPTGFLVEQYIYDPYPININVDHKRGFPPTAPVNLKNFERKLRKQLNKSLQGWLREFSSKHVVSKSFVLDVQVCGSYQDGASIRDYEDMLCTALCDPNNSLRKILKVTEMAKFCARYVWREGTLKNQLRVLIPPELYQNKAQSMCQIAELVTNGFKIGKNVLVQYQEKELLLELRDYVVVLHPWNLQTVSCLPKSVVLHTCYPKMVYLHSYNKCGPYMTTLKNANTYCAFQDSGSCYQISIELLTQRPYIFSFPLGHIP